MLTFITSAHSSSVMSSTRCVRVDAGVLREDVDAAELLGRGGRHRLHVLALGDVGRARHRALADLARGRRRGRRRPGRRRARARPRGRTPRRCTPDAARCAGDDRGAALESSRHQASFQSRSGPACRSTMSAIVSCRFASAARPSRTTTVAGRTIALKFEPLVSQYAPWPVWTSRSPTATSGSWTSSARGVVRAGLADDVGQQAVVGRRRRGCSARPGARPSACPSP